MHDHYFAGASRRRYTTARNVIVVVMTAVVMAGFLLPIPRIEILEHTARNLYFHVPMWFTLMAAIFLAGYHAIRYLATGREIHDIRSHQAARVGTVFGILGLLTGIVWARYTWYVGTGIWWNFDPKQTMAAAQLLIFGAYFVLRDSVEDESKRGRIAAVYLLFATVTMPFLLYVLPRQFESLHPGADGNPAFSDITHPIMRVVFYPASVGFIGLFWIIYTQRVRAALLRLRHDDAQLRV
jgi:heme exporter protein C